MWCTRANTGLGRTSRPDRKVEQRHQTAFVAGSLWTMASKLSYQTDEVQAEPDNMTPALPQGPQRSCRLPALSCIAWACIAWAGFATTAAAELTLCNATPSRIGVAIGYKDSRGPATEGWWNIGAQTCESLLKGPSQSRFVYVYAVDYERGGEWTGNLAMCIGDNSFTIRDITNCEGRGYRTAKFFEVDTGNAPNWTIRLADPETVETEPK
jgi:uncharacterized membrane protein